jgi:hypothetical protein
MRIAIVDGEFNRVRHGERLVAKEISLLGALSG